MLSRRRFLFAAGASLAMPSIADAGRAPKSSSPALIPRRILFRDPERGWTRISPDGMQIAFLAPRNGVLNAWVAPLADVGNARPLTNVSDRSLGPSLVWMHDNRHVLFIREQGGDENWQTY